MRRVEAAAAQRILDRAHSSRVLVLEEEAPVRGGTASQKGVREERAGGKGCEEGWDEEKQGCEEA